MLTSPGENISDPQYGVGLRYFLFENNNIFTRNEIINRIKSQVSFYVSNIDLIDVAILTDTEEINENSINIKIVYRVDNQVSEFALNMGSVSQPGYT